MRKSYIVALAGVIAFGLTACSPNDGPVAPSGSATSAGASATSTGSGATASASPTQSESGGAASSAPTAASTPAGQVTEPSIPAESVFSSPSVALTDSQTVVPNIIGLASEDAFGALMSVRLTAEVTPQTNDAVAANIVTGVSPSPGTIVDKGTQVMVVVSSGPAASSASS